MKKAFAIAGYPADELEKRFGGMYNAFRYGAPAHGGAAFGIERIVMLLAGKHFVREVVAFPLNQQGMDLMMDGPTDVYPNQLKELSIKLDVQKPKLKPVAVNE
jgi:aspartyl-tRNA synthetase